MECLQIIYRTYHNHHLQCERSQHGFQVYPLKMNLSDSNNLNLEIFDPDEQEAIDIHETVSFDMTNYVAQ